MESLELRDWARPVARDTGGCSLTLSCEARLGGAAVGGCSTSTSTKPRFVSLLATVSSVTVGESIWLNTTGLMGDASPPCVLGLSNTICAVDQPGVLTTSERVGRCGGGASSETSVISGVTGTGSGLEDVDVEDVGELERDESARSGGGVGSGRGFGDTFAKPCTFGDVEGEGMRGSGRDARAGCCWTCTFSMDEYDELVECVRYGRVDGPA